MPMSVDARKLSLLIHSFPSSPTLRTWREVARRERRERGRKSISESRSQGIAKNPLSRARVHTTSPYLHPDLVRMSADHHRQRLIILATALSAGGRRHAVEDHRRAAARPVHVPLCRAWERSEEGSEYAFRHCTFQTNRRRCFDDPREERPIASRHRSFPSRGGRHFQRIFLCTILESLIP